MIALQVVTPKEKLLEIECESVRLPGALGEFEVLEGHTALLYALKAGTLMYKTTKDAAGTEIAIGSGYAEVDHKHVTVLCESANE